MVLGEARAETTWPGEGGMLVPGPPGGFTGGNKLAEKQTCRQLHTTSIDKQITDCHLTASQIDDNSRTSLGLSAWWPQGGRRIMIFVDH